MWMSIQTLEGPMRRSFTNNSPKKTLQRSRINANTSHYLHMSLKEMLWIINRARKLPNRSKSLRWTSRSHPAVLRCYDPPTKTTNPNLLPPTLPLLKSSQSIQNPATMWPPSTRIKSSITLSLSLVFNLPLPSSRSCRITSSTRASWASRSRDRRTCWPGGSFLTKTPYLYTRTS